MSMHFADTRTGKRGALRASYVKQSVLRKPSLLKLKREAMEAEGLPGLLFFTQKIIIVIKKLMYLIITINIVTIEPVNIEQTTLRSSF